VLPFAGLLEQRVNRPPDDLRYVPVRNLMPQQRPKLLQFFMHHGVDGEANTVAIGPEWLRACPASFDLHSRRDGSGGWLGWGHGIGFAKWRDQGLGRCCSLQRGCTGKPFRAGPGRAALARPG